MEVTVANMIDRLSICNIKIYFLENAKRNPMLPDSDIAEATRKTNALNVERNNLIEEIDIVLNKMAEGYQQKLFSANKMYGND